MTLGNFREWTKDLDSDVEIDIVDGQNSWMPLTICNICRNDDDDYKPVIILDWVE